MIVFSPFKSQLRLCSLLRFHYFSTRFMMSSSFIPPFATFITNFYDIDPSFFNGIIYIASDAVVPPQTEIRLLNLPTESCLPLLNYKYHLTIPFDVSLDSLIKSGYDCIECIKKQPMKPYLICITNGDLKVHISDALQLFFMSNVLLYVSTVEELLYFSNTTATSHDIDTLEKQYVFFLELYRYLWNDGKGQSRKTVQQLIIYNPWIIYALDNIISNAGVNRTWLISLNNSDFISFGDLFYFAYTTENPRLINDFLYFLRCLIALESLNNKTFWRLDPPPWVEWHSLF